ncbi:DMT family transporter [Roseibaca sp. Y0-43]|uniref:DMT family transporter n=1 Tax=Roseibaca sp. Y0-43 TaxID=2816854 RepID=UPI001DA273E0|nr:DMT family transporter [Roseibaca sp. Y0-43]MCC1481269.1 DMT family transporter [Roseibaca sp. Y0-43]
MLLFSALVSLSFSFGHLVAGDIDPGVLMALRFALAAVVLGAVLVWMGVRPVWARFWRFALVGALMALYFITMFEALARTSAVSTSAVFTLTPLMAAGYGWLLLHQRTGAWVLSALLIGALGATWVIFRANLAALLRFEIGTGEAIFVLGALAHAAVPAVLRRFCQDVTPLQSAFATTLGALVVTCAYAAPEALGTPFMDLPARLWWVLAYLAIVTTALTFFLLQYASSRLPPAKVMAYTYLVPSWVVLWDISIGRWPNALILLGIAATLAALLMLLRAEAP